MSKRNVSITFLLLLIILGIVGCNSFGGWSSGFDIDIKNSTNEDISGLSITYDGALNDIVLPKINAGKTYKINVKPEGNFVESSMKILFKDKKGNMQENTLVGYFEKGYSGTVKVNITSQDEDGLIIMGIDSKYTFP